MCLGELSKKKYKRSIKTEKIKRYFVYISVKLDLYFLTFVEMRYTSGILLRLKINTLTKLIYFKYT